MRSDPFHPALSGRTWGDVIGSLARIGLWPFTRSAASLKQMEASRFLTIATMFIVLAVLLTTLARGLLPITCAFGFAGPVAMIPMGIGLLIEVALLLVATLVFAAASTVCIFVGSRLTSRPLQFAEAYRFVLMGSGATIWLVVPWVGIYLTLVAWVLAMTTGIAREFKQGPARFFTVVAAIVFPMALFSVLVLNGATTRTVSRSFGPLAALLPGQAYFETDLLREQLRGFALQHDGTLPRHAIEMAEPGRHFPTLVFCPPHSATRTTPASVRVAGVSLEEFINADPSRQRDLIQEQVSESAASPHSHCRFGDHVFLCAGFTAPDHARHLWIVIHSPDPAMNPDFDAEVLYIGPWGSGTLEVPRSEWESFVSSQNELRSELGLDPLESLDALLD